jgi:hypothetical protein
VVVGLVVVVCGAVEVEVELVTVTVSTIGVWLAERLDPHATSPAAAAAPSRRAAVARRILIGEGYSPLAACAPARSRRRTYL